MRLLRTTMTLVLIAGAVPVGARAQEAPHPMADSAAHFPAVTGRSLTGRTFQLPADFEGDLNVVLVAFKRRQQEDVDTWTPFLRALAARHAELRVYELPTLSSSYTLMRGFIDGGMRGGIPDSAVRAATITLYISKGPFKRALVIPNDDQIQVLLVERSGRVHWRAAGVFDEATAAGLQRAVEAGGR
jgi:hypothetical protein